MKFTLGLDGTYEPADWDKANEAFRDVANWLFPDGRNQDVRCDMYTRAMMDLKGGIFEANRLRAWVDGE